jgi:hypothetical protein
VFLEIDGEPLQQYPGIWRSVANATLTDQFGNVYKRMQYGGPGQTAMAFEPVKGPAAAGAQLTLQVSQLDVQAGPESPNIESVYGNWVLHLGVKRSAGAQSLPLPASVTAGDTTYTVTAIHKSSDLVHIDWTLSGPTVDRYTELAYSFDPLEGPSPSVRDEMQSIRGTLFPVRLLGPGVETSPSAAPELITDGTFPKDGPATGSFTALVSKPGHYTLEINFGGATASIPIDIP